MLATFPAKLTMVVVVRGFVLGINTMSLNYKFNIIFVFRNWYAKTTSLYYKLSPNKTTKTTSLY